MENFVEIVVTVKIVRIVYNTKKKGRELSRSVYSLHTHTHTHTGLAMVSYGRVV